MSLAKRIWSPVKHLEDFGENVNGFYLLTIFAKKLHFGSKYSSENVSLEAVVQRCSVINVLLDIFQNSQENTFARFSFLIKLTLLKKRPSTVVFL